MNEINLFQNGLVLFSLAAIFSLCLSKVCKHLSIVASVFTGIIASILSLTGSIFVLLHNSHIVFNFSFFIPFGEFQLIIDPLASFFILLISLLNIPVLIYSIGYLQAEYFDKNIGILGALYHLFVLSMLLVVCAGNGFLFLFLWECMTLLSFIFVISDSNNTDSQHAGFIYLLMTHIGTAFILFLFIILANYGGSFSFESFKSISSQIPNNLKFLLFLFTLIGFGTKAGLIPLHIWLPEAHPAAPSHVSALMSGVMIKTAVYGILRCVFDFLAPFPYWWGLILLGVSIVTALLGIIYASSENDIKRLLAYSSIENMGIIFLSIGIGMVFYSFGQFQLAALSIIASLFHTLNHALFKGLLFMCAGSIISVTHTRNLERLGGLIKHLPQTAFFFLIGALSACAFPLFNGFISEWLIFQSLLLSFQINSQAVKVIAPLCASLLGFVGAICAATFVKTFSSVFLALPRSHKIKYAHGVSFSMRFGMGLLAVSCFGLGILPFGILKLLDNSSSYLLKYSSSVSFNNWSIKAGSIGFASLSPISILFLFIVIFLLSYSVIKFLSCKSPLRKEETWSCGVTPAAEFEYTPTGYSQPLEVIFSQMHIPENFYYKYIYLPVVNSLVKFSHLVKPIQAGSLQIYLAYIFITLVLCLVWMNI